MEKNEIMAEKTLNEKEAYLAMFYFLDNLFDLTNDDSLGGFLGSMRLLEDGLPADRAYWEDWLDAVKKAKETK